MAYSLFQSPAGQTQTTHDGASLIKAFSHAQLSSFSPLQRLSLLQRLTDQYLPHDPAEVPEAIYALLRHAPYPKTLAKYDVKIARRYHQLLQDQPKPKYCWSSKPSAETLFREYSLMALRLMNVDPDEITLIFQKEDLTAAKHDDDDRPETLVNMLPQKLDNQYIFTMTINEANRLWRSKSPTQSEQWDIAASALHEMTHVKQFLPPGKKDPADFYDVMKKEHLALSDFLHDRRIYRCSMAERQAYLRSMAFEDIAKGWRARSEDLYVRAYLSSQQLTVAAQILLGMLPAFKPASRSQTPAPQALP